jgi:hypothetical protein
MLKKRNFNFLKNIPLYKYSNINTEETKNDCNNKIIFFKPRINLSFSKEMKNKKRRDFINIKQIKIKEEAHSNKKKPKIPILNISSNFIKTKTEKKNINKKIKKRNYSLNNIRPKLYKLTDNNDNKKRNMSKGELVEMIYGKIIKFNNELDIEIEENKRIKEILYNNPKFIIDLIEFNHVDKNEINEFFNIESFNINWNENLEKSYREIRKINSNIFKIISFLSKTGLIRKLKQNYESKNFVNFYNYNQKELEKFYDIYAKIKNYNNKKIKEAFNKIEEIYIIREILIKEKISKIRKEYYSKKLKYFKQKKKSEINLIEITEKGKAELIDIKNCIFNIRQNTNFKIFPYQKINRLKFSKSMTKYNEIIQKEMNIKNIEYKDKIRKEKIYIKEKIKKLKEENIFPNPQFIFNNFIKKTAENKKIIEYYIIMIQSNFRGFILRIFLSKLIKGIYNIINYLYSYTKFKKLILKMYAITLEAVDLFDKTKDPYFNLKINEIKKVVKIMLNNCLTRKLIFKKNEINMINKITESNIGILKVKENQIIYSNIPLINLNKYLSYLILNKIKL